MRIKMHKNIDGELNGVVDRVKLGGAPAFEDVLKNEPKMLPRKYVEGDTLMQAILKRCGEPVQLYVLEHDYLLSKETALTIAHYGTAKAKMLLADNIVAINYEGAALALIDSPCPSDELKSRLVDQLGAVKDGKRMYNIACRLAKAGPDEIRRKLLKDRMVAEFSLGGAPQVGFAVGISAGPGLKLEMAGDLKSLLFEGGDRKHLLAHAYAYSGSDEVRMKVAMVREVLQLKAGGETVADILKSKGSDEVKGQVSKTMAPPRR